MEQRCIDLKARRSQTVCNNKNDHGLINILQKAVSGFMNGAQAVESKHDNAEQMGELVQILL